jgi:hypothetical protein
VGFTLQKCKETPENKGKKVHYTCSENLKIFYSRLFLKIEKWTFINVQKQKMKNSLPKILR